jgi:hypothetical protein
MVCWLAGGRGVCGRGPDVGAAKPTSAAGGRGPRLAGPAGPRTGAGPRCRSRVAQRYQQRQRRTRCWTRPPRPLSAWKASSTVQRRPTTLTRTVSGVGRREAAVIGQLTGLAAEANTVVAGERQHVADLAGRKLDPRPAGDGRTAGPRRLVTRDPRPGGQPWLPAGHLTLACQRAVATVLEPGVGAEDLLTGRPRRRHPGIQRPGQHPGGQLGLGHKPHLVRRTDRRHRDGSLVRDRGRYSSRSTTACSAWLAFTRYTTT